MLSQYYEEQYALDLIGDSAEGVGYLLKERVGDVEAFRDAVARVAAGGSALDPEVVAVSTTIERDPGDFGREAGNLQHFKAKRHSIATYTNPASGSPLSCRRGHSAGRRTCDSRGRLN